MYTILIMYTLILLKLFFVFAFYPNFESRAFLKAKIFYNEGWSVRTSVRLERLALFVNIGMLKLSHRFQTLPDDSYNY